MKHKKYICDCCNDETTKARFISTGHLLCNVCNLKLINNKELRLNENFKLKIVGKTGDFYNIKLVKDIETVSYWESRARVKELAQMDNVSTTDWDVHGSY